LPVVTSSAPQPPAGGDAHEFASADAVAPQVLSDGIRVRPVHGRNITLAVVELDPGVQMPEHRHANEQVRVVIRGEFTFVIGGETRTRGPGDMWVIPSGVPHAVATTGETGCTLVETFSPPRADWADMPRDPAGRSRWPAR
jgi:quercetin dioxygenase-like cupin family protein